jgi:hypothetical protein
VWAPVHVALSPQGDELSPRGSWGICALALPEGLTQNLSDENFHFYNSLVLTDDLAFQRTYFWITPPNIPRLYHHAAASDDNDGLPLQNRSNLQNNELLKI